MGARTGSITVAALVGTGLATIGFALSGVSALGDDLQAARPATPVTPAPVLTPGEEGREAAPSTSPEPSASEALALEQVCDRKRREQHRREAEAAAGATTPSPTAAVGASAKEY